MPPPWESRPRAPAPRLRSSTSRQLAGSRFLRSQVIETPPILRSAPKPPGEGEIHLYWQKSHYSKRLFAHREVSPDNRWEQGRGIENGGWTEPSMQGERILL